MAAPSHNQIAPDFFGPEEDDPASVLPAGRIAIATDNARLFVGNIVNNSAPGRSQDAFSIDGASLASTLLVDSLGLTEKVLALVTRCTGSLRSCQQHAARLRIADLAVASLHTECSAIRVELNRIRTAIVQERDGRTQGRFEAYLLEEHESIAQACWLLLRVLDTNLQRLGLVDVERLDRDTLKTKLQSIWRNEQMEIASQQIGSLARGTTIVASAFQSYAHQYTLIADTTDFTQRIGTEGSWYNEKPRIEKGAVEHLRRHRIAGRVVLAAKDHVFQLMERDALPGFLKLSRPVLRMFRKTVLNPLMIGLAGRR